MKYTKKPIVIEAFQYDGDMKDSSGKVYVPEWAIKSLEDYNGNLFYHSIDSCHPGELFGATLEGDILVNVGDYVIKDIKGEIYPIKKDIFEATYEIVTDIY